jgi:MFS family permease
VKSLKVGPGYTGIILATYTVAALLIRPLTGFMLDKYGRKWIYLGGLLAFSFLFGGYGFITTLSGMILLRVLHGFFWGITTTGGSTIAVDLVPANRRGEGLGYFGLASTIPMAVGPMLGLQLIHDDRYDRLFVASIVLAVMGFVFATRIKYPKLPVHSTRFSFKNLIDPSSLPTALALFVNMITYGGVVSFISLYVKETGVGNAGLFFFIYALGITIARLVSGKIFDQKGPFRITIIGFIFIIAGFIILALVHLQAGLLISAFFMGLGGGVLFPSFQAMVNNLVQPNRRGVANSTLFTALDLGIGMGMMLTGYLAGSIGLGYAFLICSFINLIALFIFVGYSHKHYLSHKIVYNK